MSDAYRSGGALPKMPRGDGNRARHTMQNNLSKQSGGAAGGGTGYTNPGGAAALPALSPDQTANYYAQLAGLASQYQTDIAGYRAQRIGLRAGYKQTRAGIRADLISGLSGVQADAGGRGVRGSSAELNSEIGVRAGAASQTAEAKNQLLQGLAQNRIGVQTAGNKYFLDESALASQKLAMQQQALSDELRNNLIVSGQESQMDVLKSIYQALSSSTNRGGTPTAPGAPLPSAQAGNTIYNGDNEMLQIITGLGRAAGVGLYG